MAYLEDKIEQVQDKTLRDVLLAEVKKLKKGKKFGLVFEEHVPELVPVYGAPIRPRSTVALKDGNLLETFRVKCIKDGSAIVNKDVDGNESVYPLEQLVVVQRFGVAIYPALIPVATVENGGNRPFHSLIEADNFHALQLLEYLYAGQVDCIYIDPPYNTSAKDWKYNNNYVDMNDSWRHSKWLSMMKKRLLLAKQLLRPTGILIITIDDYEIHHLRCLLETSLLSELNNLGIACIRSKPGGRATLNGMAVNHEYAIFLGRSPETQLGRMPRTEGQIARYNHIDERGAFKWVNFRKHGADSSRDDRPKQYYPIYVCGQKIKIPQMAWDQKIKMWVGIEEPNANELIVWPINPRGGEKVWIWGSDRVKDNLSEFEARKNIRLNSAAILVIIKRQQENPTDTWLFQVHSNRAKDKPVSRVSVSRVFKDAGELLGLTINTHSMRKSRGMAMYKDGVPVEKIAKVLNHSNTTSTLRYLGITQEEVLKTYDDYEL